jgi:hypothetical protein
MTEPHKRTAFEPLERLATPTPYDPGMKRPSSTVAGAVIVFLGVLANALWVMEVALNWDELAKGIGVVVGDDAITSDVLAVGRVSFVVVWSIILLIEGVLGVLVLRGRNWPRVVVMTFSVISITSTFVGWWVEGQEITLRTSLLSLAFDILVLLALSSRSAAAYARRNERRDPR